MTTIIARRVLALVLLGACGTFAGCGSSGSGGAGDTTGEVGSTGGGETSDRDPEYVYWRDVEPIIEARCRSCHNIGGVSPFAFETFADAQMFAPLIAAAVEGGTMPPWKPNPECNRYFGERLMSDAERDAIIGWADSDAPEGDPADIGTPLEVEEFGLSRVDLTLEMPEPYVQQEHPDENRCFLFPLNLTEDTYVTGMRVNPGNRAVAHHALVFMLDPDQVAAVQALDAEEDGPGYSCFGGVGAPQSGALGSWTPGTRGADMPEGTGVAVEAGSMLVLQMHYNSVEAGGEPDQTSIDLKLDARVDREAFSLPLVSSDWPGGGLPIPAGHPDVVHSHTWDAVAYAVLDSQGVISPGSPIHIHAVGGHMHYLGTQLTVSLEHPDGTSDCVVQIDDWDFSWQGRYYLREPIVAQAGDRIRLECHWDNSAANQPFDGEPQRVNWGLGTADEMCVSSVVVTAP